MMDRETTSLWSQISGEAIKGKLEGKKLTLFPNFNTTFNEFKRRYPNGKLLKKPGRSRHGSPYDDYFSSPDKIGIFGRKNTFTKLPAKSEVFGLRLDDHQYAISVDRLSKDGMVWITKETPPVLVSYDKETKTALAFAVDKPDGVTPDNITIRGTDVFDSNGNKLHAKELPITSAFWFAWASFFPNTELIN